MTVQNTLRPSTITPIQETTPSVVRPKTDPIVQSGPDTRDVFDVRGAPRTRGAAARCASAPAPAPPMTDVPAGRKKATTRYLYHFAPSECLRNTLFPRRQLWALPEWPDSKPNLEMTDGKRDYRKKLDHLHFGSPVDCYWDEVIFLAPINPQLVWAAMHKAGLNGDGVFGRCDWGDFYKIPVEVVEGKEADMGVWLFKPEIFAERGKTKSPNVPDNDMSAFSVHGTKEIPPYRELTEVPEPAKQYFSDWARGKRPQGDGVEKSPLPYKFVPHVVCKVPIELPNKLEEEHINPTDGIVSPTLRDAAEKLLSDSGPDEGIGGILSSIKSAYSAHCSASNGQKSLRSLETVENDLRLLGIVVRASRWTNPTQERDLLKATELQMRHCAAA